ncbi:hypothetical protein KVV02_001270 [Mortierella alpina]|uniref:Uncharacterized protein n=1 Tax=Mortierella alpina TaxID=64518 RepID=A0A9P8A394_MORAP|nr:hypothetical protein KVV02_001270 [Mortierella alpina]
MDFPKINVSSKADIQYITQIWRKALYNRLEQQYANRSDPRLLQEVQLMLDQWLENMVKMASAGIDINGIPYDEAIKNEDVEPLDESLTRRLQAQQQQVEELTLSVAERRKRVPEQVKMLLDDAIKRQSALADRIEFEPEEGKQDQNEDSDMENAALERPELVAQEFATSMELLGGLRKTVSANVTQLEKTQTLVEEIMP